MLDGSEVGWNGPSVASFTQVSQTNLGFTFPDSERLIPGFGFQDQKAKHR